MTTPFIANLYFCSIFELQTTLPSLETDFNQRVNLIVAKTREMRRSSYYPQLYVIKEDGDPALRLWFLSHLIEDRAEPVMSYHQYLGHLKDKVIYATIQYFLSLNDMSVPTFFLNL